jgi:hypothetical protein
MLVAAAKILAVKAGTLIKLACLPCRPACLVCAHHYRPCFVEVDVLQTIMP